MKTSCLVIAGEKSGEEHALSFFKDLRERSPDIEFFGVGGDGLKEQGLDLIYHLNDFSSVGITEVLKKLPFYFKALGRILSEVKKRNCKTAILVDFQGFNLKLAQKLKKKKVNVLYYVAPQAWAWKAYRAKSIAKCVHTLFTILPFEKKWFQDRGVKNIKGVIHPLALEFSSELDQVRKRRHQDFENRAIRVLLLPGSRNSEVRSLMSTFLGAIGILKEEGFDIELGLVKVSSIKEENYLEMEGMKVWTSESLFEACQWADMCLATSGTVTLATGLFGLPTVVSYKLSLTNEFILGMFIPYDGPVSLTNIVHEERVFPEFLQYHADRYNLSRSLRKWIQSPQEYDELCGKLLKTKDKLSGDDFDLPDYMLEVIGGKNA